MTIITNAKIFDENGKFKDADLILQDGKIAQIAPIGSLGEKATLDAQGKYVLPGFIDIHIHGCAGSDFCDAEEQAVETMAAYLCSVGVTSFCGTTMSYDEDTLAKVMDNSNKFVNVHTGKAVHRGVNMEGPFINKAKKGAQSEKNIYSPDIGMFERLYERSGKTIKLVDIAPEEENAIEFISAASKKCRVSIAHTGANYDESSAAFEHGASHVTHLYNAMPPHSHREPGVIGAAFDNASYVEIISDGIHLHPSIVRSTFAMFGKDRVCLISDSMRACGMPNGEYTLGGLKVIMKDGKATLVDGTIAGSATNLFECTRRAVKFGVPLESAVCAATINPAKAVGIFDKVGSITQGKEADIVIVDEQLNLYNVFVGGKCIK